nr:hypothetical protein [Tanacetum cinerariifolium]
MMLVMALTWWQQAAGEGDGVAVGNKMHKAFPLPVTVKCNIMYKDSLYYKKSPLVLVEIIQRRWLAWERDGGCSGGFGGGGGAWWRVVWWIE